MKVTTNQLRHIIQETVRRKLEMGPDDPAHTLYREPLQLEGRLTLEQLQQVIDEEYEAVLDEACGCGGMDEEETFMDEEMMSLDIDEAALPSRKKPKGVKNPWAVAWASYNKSQGG